MGAVTGKGLSDLIREEFGFRVTFFLMVALVVTNFGNVMAEFAGVASSLELFGCPGTSSCPLAACVVWVARGAGDVPERREDLPRGVGLLRLLHRRGRARAARLEGRRRSRPSRGRKPRGIRNYGYLYMVIGLVGTTIAPWMQFYLQASIVEKGRHGRASTARRAGT